MRPNIMGDNFIWQHTHFCTLVILLTTEETIVIILIIMIIKESLCLWKGNAALYYSVWKEINIHHIWIFSEDFPVIFQVGTADSFLQSSSLVYCFCCCGGNVVTVPISQSFLFYSKFLSTYKWLLQTQHSPHLLEPMGKMLKSLTFILYSRCVISHRFRKILWFM